MFSWAREIEFVNGRWTTLEIIPQTEDLLKSTLVVYAPLTRISRVSHRHPSSEILSLFHSQQMSPVNSQ